MNNNYEARITTEPRPVGNFILLYGPPGVGKTTFASQAPGAIVLQVKDHSLDVLVRSGVMSPVPSVNAENWDDALGFLDYLEEGKHEYRVLIIDGASGLEAFCDDSTREDEFKDDLRKYLDFGKGPIFSASRWADFLNKVDRLKAKGMTVMLLAHRGVSEVKNADGTNYYKFVPSMNEKKYVPTLAYTDAILRMDYPIAIKDVNDLTGKGKAVGGTQRVLYCTGEASFDAKNRLNLPPLIGLGNSHEQAWAAFVAAAGKGRK